MVAKKTTANKPTKRTKKVAHKSTAKKTAQMKSFKLYKDVKPFTTFQITRQTAYWTILLVFIIIIQLWILRVQMDIANATLDLLAK